MKPGIKTSEFISILLALAGVFLTVHGAMKGDATAMSIGAGLLGTGGLGYNLSRGMAKKGGGDGTG